MSLTRICRSYPKKGRTPFLKTQKMTNKSAIVFQKCILNEPGKESYPPNEQAALSFSKILANHISYPKRHFLSLRKQKAWNFLMLRNFKSTFFLKKLKTLICILVNCECLIWLQKPSEPPFIDTQYCQGLSFAKTYVKNNNFMIAKSKFPGNHSHDFFVWGSFSTNYIAYVISHDLA